LTRDIPVLVTSAGLRIEQLSTVYLSHFPKSWSHCSVGIAIRECSTARAQQVSTTL
jgi:hypothetical protein